MAILVDVTQGERLKLPRRGVEIYRTPREATPPIAVIDVDRALKRRDDVQVTVVIEVPDNQRSTWHDPLRPRFRERRVELPVPRPIAEIDLEAGRSISEQDEVQMAVSVEIAERRGHITVLSPKSLSREPSSAVAQEGLHDSEVAGRHDVREPIAVNIAAGEGGVADIGPRGVDRREGPFTVTHPHVEGGLDEPGRRHQIEVPITVEVKGEGIKAPLYPRSERQDLGVGRK